MKMEKVFWQGTFEDAEERDNIYWGEKTEEERLTAMLEMRQIFFEGVNEPIQKVAFIKKINEQE